MSVNLLAEFEALTHVAVVQRESRNELIRVQKARRDVDFPAESLGTFNPAREVLQSFRGLDQAVRRDLWMITQRCEFLSDTIRDVRDDFRRVDRSISDVFERIREGQLLMTHQGEKVQW